jgi:RimJ/RimL family protein N-acetyltransferase
VSQYLDMLDGIADVRTERLRLRRITESDVAAVAALSCDPQVNQHSPSGAPTLQEARASAQGFVEDWLRDGIGYWVAELDGDLVGVSGIRSATLEGEKCWNLYYRFAPAAWGRGLARESAEAAVFVAGQLEPDRAVVVRTRPSNEAAIRVALAIGMSRAPGRDSDGFITFVAHAESPDG